jgi:tripartite-type tricarboxylate transporter receptor subunit TctC
MKRPHAHRNIRSSNAELEDSMSNVQRRRILLSGLAGMAGLSAAALPRQASADEAWPARPIRMVVPFGAGGSSDVFGRLLGTQLQTAIGQPIVVDNKPGAGGVVGAQAVASAAPDGYTLLLATNGPLVAVRHGKTRPPYEPERAFTPVAMLSEVPMAIMVRANSPVHDIRDLLAAKGKSFAFATPGPGTTGHVAGEWLGKRAGIDMVHVPYKSSGAAVNDLLAGVVPLAVDSLASYLGHVKAGTVKVIAVLTQSRFPDLPDVPTLMELGVPLKLSLWFAMMAPARTPMPIVQRLNRELTAIVQRPDNAPRLSAMAARPMSLPASEIPSFLNSESRDWKQMLDETGIETT